MIVDERIAIRRAELEKQRAERTDELDLPRTMTMRQVRDYVAETARIDAEIAGLNSAVENFAALPPIEADIRWLAHLVAWRETMCDELLTIKSPIRDKALKERAQLLEFSIKLIDRGWAANRFPAPIVDLSATRIGELMAAAGYDTVGAEQLRGPNGFRGSFDETEQRIKTITKQRATAESALDAAVMTDAERAAQTVENAELAAAFNSMRIKMRSDGMGYIAYTADGDVLDVSNMTPIQRQAFEKMDARERVFQQSVIDRQSVST